MRVAIGEIKNETNTFAAVPVTLQHFIDFHLFYGEAVITGLQDTNTEIGGFLDVLMDAGIEAVPTLAGFALSGAPVTDETFAALRSELLTRLAGAGPIDAILLALHGAMVADSEPDASGALIQAVRGAFGPAMPIVVTMDLHANLTRRCVQDANVIVGFKTCPHIDQRDTGQRAARILVRWLRGEVNPVMAFEKVPMVVPASTHIHDQVGPFQRLMDATKTLEAGGLLSASAFTVQPWLDIPEMGFGMVAIADGNRSRAQDAACRLAEQAWSERRAFLDIQLVPPDEAIAKALAMPEGPVVLSDLADGTGAGSPGDSTSVIKALLNAQPDRPAYVYCFDPETAEAAARIGVGNAIDVFVGGKRDHIYNQPVRFQGLVQYAQLSAFRFGGQGYTGITMDMGLSAVLQHGNVFLLVTSKSVMTVDPALFRAVGLEPMDAQIVVVKSHIQFRAGYEGLAKAIILLDSPGMSSDHLETLRWRDVSRPLFPLDETIHYACTWGT